MKSFLFLKTCHPDRSHVIRGADGAVSKDPYSLKLPEWWVTPEMSLPCIGSQPRIENRELAHPYIYRHT
jgi:hypothetical protein